MESEGRGLSGRQGSPNDNVVPFPGARGPGGPHPAEMPRAPLDTPTPDGAAGAALSAADFWSGDAAVAPAVQAPVEAAPAGQRGGSAPSRKVSPYAAGEEFVPVGRAAADEARIPGERVAHARGRAPVSLSSRLRRRWGRFRFSRPERPMASATARRRLACVTLTLCLGVLLTVALSQGGARQKPAHDELALSNRTSKMPASSLTALTPAEVKQAMHRTDGAARARSRARTHTTRHQARRHHAAPSGQSARRSRPRAGTTTYVSHPAVAAAGTPAQGSTVAAPGATQSAASGRSASGGGSGSSASSQQPYGYGGLLGAGSSPSG